MSTMQYNSRETIYKGSLNEINNIKFTMREIDIVSCILHNKTNKKIALTLSISDRTVESHIYNIVSKLNKNSKDAIITFIEQSGTLPIFRKYYSCLLIKNCFNQHLRKIATLNPQGITCIINNAHLDPGQQDPFNIKLSQLQKDLKLANIFLNPNKNNNSNTTPTLKLSVNVVTNSTEPEINDSITFIFDQNSKSTASQPIKINFQSEQDYIFNVFDLLTKIIDPTEKITLIKEEFKKNYYSIINNYDNKITTKIINIKKHKYKLSLLLGVALSCAIILIIVYKFYRHTQPKLDIQEIKPIRTRILQASEYYNTDQTTTELAKKNNVNLLILQKDIDYLIKHPKYIYTDDLFQSKFAYLTFVLSAYYRWNKNIDMLIDEYLDKEYNVCSKYYQQKRTEMFHSCISSNILDRTIKYYENRYKFSIQDPVKIIKFKLEREPYAWEDFILLSYNTARAYFPKDSWSKAELEYVNKLLNLVIDYGAENKYKGKLIEMYLAKKYKLTIKRNQLENYLKLFKLSQDNKAKSQNILSTVKDVLLANLNELKTININLLPLLDDSSSYINHYKPWFKTNNGKTDIFIPSKVIFNITTIYGDILLTQANMVLYNSLLYNVELNVLHQNNQKILSQSLEILNKFIDAMENSWNDISLNNNKQKMIQALKIFLEADFGNYELNTDIKDILNQLLEESLNVVILKNNIKQLQIKIR